MPAAAAPATGSTATLALLETTDLHSNILSYDYFKLAPDPSIGLERTATLIAEARRQFANTLLLDNGDAIQGTALADYQALVKPVPCAQPLAIYKAMNALGYEGGGVGNHEFNYGLAFLGQVTGSRFDVAGVKPHKACAGPNFPLVLANVYSTKTHKPLFAPYRIIDKKVTATGPDGRAISATIKIGIIGFAPPAILAWDKRWLDGRVYTEGLRETALKYIPEMRAKGADLVIAISHGGLDAAPYAPTMENGSYHLSQVPGAAIDALLLGHSHELFPNAASRVGQFNLPGVDKARGMVNGVPTVMAQLWGKALGVISLNLAFDGRHWVVDKDKTVVEARTIANPDKSFVAPDAAIATLAAPEHEATIAYVKTAVGSTAQRLTSYFADEGDVSTMRVVNAAQADYVARYLKANLPHYASLPVLSVTAPFKTGFADAADYTDVPAGPLSLANAADLYLYPNTLHAVKVSGAELKAWLEQSARRYNTIDPARTTAQELINPGYQGYNADTPTSAELQYEIDLTRAPGERIINMTYRGAPLDAVQEFIVATNSYRASGGGNFPGLDGSKTVIASPDTNRDILIDYIKQVKRLDASDARSWRFAKLRTAGLVVFHSAPVGTSVAQQAGLQNVTMSSADDGQGKGQALYSIDLSR
ncbi:MAG: bifunctional 2',3'-cyclic-nucleotide 2'-phosphodiesterase/3'-nucleotidase [Pseudomonadota bacterium]